MIYFYFTESIKSFNRAKLASLVTIFVTCIAILLTITSLTLVLLSRNLNDYLKSQIRINVFIADSLSDNDIQVLKSNLENDAYVQNVQYINKTDAVKKFIEDTGEDFRKLLDINPLPASFTIRLKPEKVDEKSLTALADKVGKMKGVDDVVYEYDLILKMLNFLFSFELLIYAAAFISILLSVYLVYSINKFIIHTKTGEYNTMKLVGARLKIIRIPILINGLIIGMISGVICALGYNLLLVLLNKIYHNINFTKWYYLINLVIIIFGIIFGLLGSFLATRKITLKIESF